MQKTLLVVYYSKTGTTQRMAAEIARGANDAGANVISKAVENCTVADVLKSDAIAFGTPTHYSNIAWQAKKFLDETILDFYTQGHSLKGKMCSCFTSTGVYDDGKECLRMMELAFGVTLKMTMISGIVLQSDRVTNGDIAQCYESGQEIAKRITSQS